MKRNRILVILIVLLGFALRIIGFRWGGQDQIFHPDEWGVVEPIIVMVQEYSYIHYTWTYPSMCTSKLLALMLMPVNALHELDWIEYYYVTRFFYAVFSTIIILLSYELVRKAEGEKFALIFSFLIAINPIYIKYAKMAVGDTPVLMFWLLVALFARRYILHKKVSDLVLMSVFAACATLEKWNGAGITVLIAITVIYHNRRNIKQLFIHGIISFLAWVLGVIIIAPNIVIDFLGVIGSIVSANQHLGSNLIQKHFTIYFTYAGIASLALLLVGVFVLITGLYSGMGETDEIIATRFVYLFVPVDLLVEWIAAEQTLERHGLEIHWGCTLLILIGALWLYSRKGVWRSISVIIASLFICSWVLHGVLYNVIAVRSRDHDTRAVGVKYLEELGATTDNSIGELYTPYLPPMSIHGMEANYPADVLFIHDDEPCIAVSGKCYAIVGDYWSVNRSSGGYKVLYEYAPKVGELISDDPKADLFWLSNGQGNWSYFELDTIRNTINQIKSTLSANTIGPSFEVYDISGFKYVSR